MDREITWGAAWSLSGFGKATLFLFQMEVNVSISFFLCNLTIKW